LEAVLTIGTHLIPHPRKAETGGEDAFFVNGDDGGVFAVADGVSGYTIFAAMNCFVLLSLKKTASINCRLCFCFLPFNFGLISALLKKIHGVFSNSH
jgi:hypothetical protein